MHRKMNSGMLVFMVASVIALTLFASPVWAQTRPALVKDVENPAQNPYWGYDSGTISAGWVNVNLDVATIASGKRLVIEHVAVNCTSDQDDNIYRATIGIYKKSASGWTNYGVPVPVQKQGPTYDGKASWTVSQPVRLYSDGVGSPTTIDIRHSKITSDASCFAVISGYTVDTP
jgi:hypothetical protein